MTAYTGHIKPTDTESLLDDTDTYAPERPYPPHRQLRYSEVCRLLNLKIPTPELWAWLQEHGVTVRGIGHRRVSYGDLVKAGLIR